ncbi:hypothetical protein HYC85_024049 [Camellia sinensis]|uniref:CSC1/OSCA1-like 7TM region domain-containing protein n=1 Tax=Camellia sinensis TaxID=4442 RepID=A0A7J7G6Z7_CAMSI|nr:hypothetical protein HYC85_024049 [Camellia sinensis]
MVIPLSDSSQSDYDCDCNLDFEVLSLSIVSTTFYNLRKIDRILQNLLQLGDSSCGVHLCGFGTLRLLRSVRSEKEAKHIASKIEDLTHHSLTKKHNREYSLSDAFQQDGKITRYGERLEELCHKIRHIQCKKMLEEKELPVAFVTFRNRWGATLAAQSQQHSNPLIWITEMAPEPRDSIPYRHLPLYKIGVFVAASLLTLFFAIPVTAVQGIAKYERLKTWFPPAMAVHLIPSLGPVIIGYLPTAILSGFIYVIPFAMLGMAKLEGYVLRSKKEINACNMVFYFLLGNVFFLTLLSGSLLDQIGKSVTYPRDFPSHLASAVSAQADFFMTYILTNGLAGFSLETY